MKRGFSIFQLVFVTMVSSMLLLATAATPVTAQRAGGGGTPSAGGGSPVGGMLGIGILSTINRTNRPKTVTPPKTRKTAPKTRKKPTTAKTKVKRKKKVTRKAKPRPAPSRNAGPAVAAQVLTDRKADELLVFFDDTQPPGAADEVARRFGLTRLESLDVDLLGGTVERYSIGGGRQIDTMIEVLAVDPTVTVVQPNYIYRTSGSSNQVQNTGAQYALAKLDVGPAHEMATGRGVSVAVIDTAIDLKHPSLADVSVRVFDAVGDGKMQGLQHGTAIGGLISGKGRVQGVAPSAKLLAVRAFKKDGPNKKPETSSFILLRSFDWAAANDARVFNMSFAGPADPLVNKTLDMVHSKGIVLVAAAGNAGPKAAPAYPAAYRNVIAITALDHKDRLYKMANQGKHLTAAAPGVDVLVPTSKGRYGFSTGTSLAAAYVSGIVALMMERDPYASAKAIRRTIVITAHDLGPEGHDHQFGAGRADAHASLTQLTAY